MAGDRHPRADGPTLGARALMRAIEELAAARRLVDFRVAYKQNAKGEHVVALIYRSHQLGPRNVPLFDLRL